MKLFKNIFKSTDEKFAEIGFEKISEDKYGVEYCRYNEKFNFYHTIGIWHKRNGYHIVQSYDKHRMDNDRIGNLCVGLTMYEMELCLKKMKDMGWKKKSE